MTFFLCIYFFFAGVTWVAGEAGVGIMGRLAIGDLLLLPLIAWLVVAHPRGIRVSRLGRAALVLMMAFTLGMLNTQRVTESLVEWAVHLFLIVGFITLYSLIAARPLDERFEIAAWWVRMGALLALVGIWEFVAPLVALPSLLGVVGKAPAYTSAVVGTFRNSGQAGMFFVIVLATAVPLLRGGTGRRKTEMAVYIALLAVAMILTVKRAAMVASGAGVLLLFITERGWKGRMWSTVAVAVAMAAAIPAFQWASNRSAAFEGRVQRKLGATASERFESFARSNVAVAREAFAEHPVTGVGLGGVAGVYSEKYEIHSTYLSIPATTGIVGGVAYLWFVFVMFQSFTTPRNGDPRAALYARTVRSLMLGLMISFGYTYHLRKREFWITAAIASALMAPEAGGRRRAGPAALPFGAPARLGPPAEEAAVAAAG